MLIDDMDAVQLHAALEILCRYVETEQEMGRWSDALDAICAMQDLLHKNGHECDSESQRRIKSLRATVVGW